MLELAVGRQRQKALGHQPLQLLGDVKRRLCGVFAVLDLALGHGKFEQNYSRKARDFAGNQAQAAAPVIDALFEVSLVGRQRLLQKSPIQRNLDDLLAQLFQRAAARVVGGAADQHVGRGHFLQLGQVFLQVFQRIPDLQGKQPAQASAVFGRCQLGFVKHFNGHRIAQIDQCRKTNQRLLAFADFHQFRQLAKAPAGVALRRAGWNRLLICYVFRSCLRTSRIG